MNEEYILDEQMTLLGCGAPDVIGFGCREFFIKEIERSLANDIIIKNHYSHKIYSATYIHLGVFINGTLVGVLQFGYAMNPASQASVVKNTNIDEYLELNRMWIDDCAGRNTESRAISYSIKYIKRKFKGKIKWIQSFADERCGCYGIVYQACNFKYYGEHNSDFWELDGIVYHNSLMTRNPKLSKSAEILQNGKERAVKSSLRQFRYLYFIDRRCERDCCLKQKPYPKYYKEKGEQKND